MDSKHAAIETAGKIADGASVTIMVATVFQWLPAVAALITIVWTGIRIWETNTVQKWFNRKKK
tara:strand:+ start:65 stop:253 length:189 start_codon:yes stop_codon:yes gene_type:complete